MKRPYVGAFQGTNERRDGGGIPSTVAFYPWVRVRIRVKVQDKRIRVLSKGKKVKLVVDVYGVVPLP